MKLNDSTLRNKVKGYLESDKFQKNYAKQNSIKPLGYKYYWDADDIEDVVNRLKKKIWLASVLLTTREYDGSSSLAGMDYRALLSHRVTNIKRDRKTPKWITSCKVELFFNPDWVHVASLYPKGYPNGVDNIVRLLTNGYDFRMLQDRDPSAITLQHRGRMHGDWHLGSPKSKRVVSNVYTVTYRRGNPILFDYIDEFNREEEAVFASLNESFRLAFGIGGLRPPYNPSGNSQIDSWDITGIGTIRFGIKL